MSPNIPLCNHLHPSVPPTPPAPLIPTPTPSPPAPLVTPALNSTSGPASFLSLEGPTYTHCHTLSHTVTHTAPHSVTYLHTLAQEIHNPLPLSFPQRPPLPALPPPLEAGLSLERWRGHWNVTMQVWGMDRSWTPLGEQICCFSSFSRNYLYY